MVRARAFDEAAVLDAAMNSFWLRGYTATSVRDLGAVMGLGAASLYNAFGDKRALFTRCLDRYLDDNMRTRLARLEASLPPRLALEGFVREVVDRSLADRRGCMLVNAALEVAPHDEEVGAVIAARLGEIEAFMRRCIASGQVDGSIDATRDAADLARLLLATVLGIRVLARGRPERALLEGAARTALALLQPTADQSPPETTGPETTREETA